MPTGVESGKFSEVYIAPICLYYAMRPNCLVSLNELDRCQITTTSAPYNGTYGLTGAKTVAPLVRCSVPLATTLLQPLRRLEPSFRYHLIIRGTQNIEDGLKTLWQLRRPAGVQPALDCVHTVFRSVEGVFGQFYRLDTGS